MEEMIGIIILNYNTPEETNLCIESIQKNVKVKYQIYVVDNHSNEANRENLISSLSGRDVRLIMLDENLGYSGGNNAGISSAISDKVKYIMIVNSDVVFDNDVCFYLLNSLDKDVVAAGPKVVRYDGSDGQNLINTYSYKNAIFDRRPFCDFSKIFTSLNAEIKTPDEKLIFDGMVSGCCFLIDAEKFVNIGCFDDNVFLYSEERIMSIKLRQKNYKTAYIPEAIIHHLEGNSTKKEDNSFADYHRYISDYYTVITYMKPSKLKRDIFKAIRLINFRLKGVGKMSYREKYKILKQKMKEIDEGNLKIKYM